ncbi:SLAM family member 9-like isoform X2 [Mixophyes fleayi]|uniref:SLAM family member 9-like isoform X2 n=1 Tax=Mixophyes fleayi TaxID=3061075 RepID=UPI003F4DA4B1
MLTFPCYILMVTYLQTIFSGQVCKKLVHLSVEEGKNALLQINETEVEEISWILHTNHIATTMPDKPISVKDRKLKRWLHSLTDGSLKMINVTRHNEGSYTANIFKKSEEHCTQRYRLKVYPRLSEQDVYISVNVSINETCGMTLTCTVNGSDVKIFWSENGTAVTNRTLNLYGIRPSISYKCIAKNPVSRVSKTVTPWTYCPEETNISQLQLSGSPGILTALLCIAVVIIAGAIFVAFTLVKKRKAKKLDHRGEPPTIYAKVLKQDRDSAAFSSTPRCPDNETTLYATITNHVK